MKLAAFIFAAGLCWGTASPTNPTLPRSVPPSVRPIVFGAIIPVHSGTDLQAAYNSAACGSDLVLDAGITKTGNYVFNKQCGAGMWILVEGAGCNAGTVPIPAYVTTTAANLGPSLPFPPPALTNYATLASPNGVPPLSTTDSMNNPATYNYFGCLEVTSPTASAFELVSLSNNGFETVVSQLGDHIMLDRLYVHGLASSGTVQVTHGIIATGSNVSIINSYVSNIYSGGDSQAIFCSKGPGPILVQNNFLSASTEIMMCGGDGPTPGRSCTIAASPAPTTTSATVGTCIDANGGSVPTPPIGTQVMFFTSASAPLYSPLDYATITGNTAGALSFAAIPSAPLSGAAKAQWGIVPADITVTKNFFWKNPCWNPMDACYDGISRSSKDFIESKYGQRWNINANIFENTFNQGQQYAFNFNSADQNGGCPWCTSSDITLQNFVVKNTPGDLSIISTQGGTGSCPGLLNRVLISNGIFFTPGSGTSNPSGGRVFSLTRDNGGCTYPQQQAADSLQINHVTMPGGGSLGILSDDNPFNYSNLSFANNIWEMDQCRLYVVSGAGCSTDPLLTSNSTTSGTWTLAKNATINSGAINGGSGVNDATLISKYGSGILPTLYDTTQAMNYAGAPFASYSTIYTDYHGLALAGSGPWRNAASDGTDPGVNFTTLDAALGGGPVLTCDLNHDGLINSLDVQLQTNQYLGIASCTNPLTGSCNSASVQRVINAALGSACVLGP